MSVLSEPLIFSILLDHQLFLCPAALVNAVLSVVWSNRSGKSRTRWVTGVNTHMVQMVPTDRGSTNRGWS